MKIGVNIYKYKLTHNVIHVSAVKPSNNTNSKRCLQKWGWQKVNCQAAPSLLQVDLGTDHMNTPQTQERSQPENQCQLKLAALWV